MVFNPSEVNHSDLPPDRLRQTLWLIVAIWVTGGIGHFTILKEWAAPRGDQWLAHPQNPKSLGRRHATPDHHGSHGDRDGTYLVLGAGATRLQP